MGTGRRTIARLREEGRLQGGGCLGAGCWLQTCSSDGSGRGGMEKRTFHTEGRMREARES